MLNEVYEMIKNIVEALKRILLALYLNSDIMLIE
jgi:hypothetical protein